MFFENISLTVNRIKLIQEIWTPYLIFQSETKTGMESIIPCWCGSDVWYIAIMPTSVYHILGKEEFLNLVNHNPPYVYSHHVFYTYPPQPFYGINAEISGHSIYGHPNVVFVNPNYKDRFFYSLAYDWPVHQERYLRILDWLKEGLPII